MTFKMITLSLKEYKIYANFLNNLAKELTKFYNLKLNKTFKISNKLKNKGYDPVTTSDKAFEKFIRSKINKKFPKHQIIGEEYGLKKSHSDFTWVIDPIDGTRSFVIGNPTWISNNIRSGSINWINHPRKFTFGIFMTILFTYNLMCWKFFRNFRSYEFFKCFI